MSTSETDARAILRRPAAVFVAWFPWFLAAYFVAQTLRRLVEAPNLNVDEADFMVPTQAFAWGYGAHPPLYAWLQMLLFETFGRSVLSFALLKNLLLFGAFYFIFRTALSVLGDRTRAVAVAMSTFLLPQILWEDQLAQSHSVAVVFATAATAFVLVRLMSRPTLTAYGLLGVVVAVGVLSKYNYLLFLLGLAGAALTVPSGRRALVDRRTLLVSLPIAVAAILPTALWSLSNLSIALSRTPKFMIDTETSRWNVMAVGLGDLALAVAGFSAICLAVYGAVAFFPYERFALFRAISARLVGGVGTGDRTGPGLT